MTGVWEYRVFARGDHTAAVKAAISALAACGPPEKRSDAYVTAVGPAAVPALCDAHGFKIRGGKALVELKRRLARDSGGAERWMKETAPAAVVLAATHDPVLIVRGTYPCLEATGPVHGVVEVGKVRWATGIMDRAVECTLLSVAPRSAFTTLCVEGGDLPGIYAVVRHLGLCTLLPPAAVLRSRAPEGGARDAAAGTSAAVGMGYPEFVARMSEWLATPSLADLGDLACLPIGGGCAGGPGVADAIAAADADALRLALLQHPAGATTVIDAKRLTTPLHAAVKGGATELVRLLLLAGARPNAGNHKGRRPLHMAAHAQRWDLAALLLLHGADADAVDKDDCRALDRCGGGAATRHFASLLVRDASCVRVAPLSLLHPMTQEHMAAITAITGADKK